MHTKTTQPDRRISNVGYKINYVTKNVIVCMAQQKKNVPRIQRSLWIGWFLQLIQYLCDWGRGDLRFCLLSREYAWHKLKEHHIHRLCHTPSERT